jgi:hypothetical protein
MRGVIPTPLTRTSAVVRSYYADSFSNITNLWLIWTVQLAGWRTGKIHEKLGLNLVEALVIVTGVFYGFP